MEAKQTKELEPQQYQQLYWEEDVPLQDVRKNALRKFVYIGAILCLVFVTIGFFVKFPDQIELPLSPGVINRKKSTVFPPLFM